MASEDDERSTLSPGLVRPPNRDDAGLGGVDDAAALKEARQLLGLSLADLADSLQIRATYLEMVEEGRYNDLPGPGYTRSIIARYALQVGLDPDLMVARIRDSPSATRAADQVPREPGPLPTEPGRQGTAARMTPVSAEASRKRTDSDRVSAMIAAFSAANARGLDALDQPAPVRRARSSRSRRRHSRRVPRVWLLAGLLAAGLLAVIMVVLRMLGLGG